MINIVNVFWEKEQEYANKNFKSENAFGKYLSNRYGVTFNLAMYRRCGRLLNIKYIDEIAKFLNDDELFIYINYMCDKSERDDAETEEIASDYLLKLNISQELKEYTRARRKAQRDKMYEAMRKERGE